jgi:hypothetical protein
VLGKFGARALKWANGALQLGAWSAAAGELSTGGGAALADAIYALLE